MKLRDLNLAIVYVNLAHREDRRAEVEYQLTALGWTALRQPGIRADRVRDPWGFQNERRYGCSLAKRLAIRRGMRTGADAVLLLEDDVVLHPELPARLAELDLPDDWGLFYLGCRHCSRPQVHGRGLVKCTRATDNHAVVVHRSYYWRVLRGLSGTRRGGARTIAYSDLQLAGQQQQIPAFAAFPNLAWQAYSWSDTGNKPLTAYHPDGRQALLEDQMAEVTAEMVAKYPQSDPGRLRESSCTSAQENREPVNPVAVLGVSADPQPRFPEKNPMPDGGEPVVLSVFRGSPRFAFQERFPFMACVNLARRPDRRLAAWKQFEQQGLSVTRRPAVDARFVRNVRGFGSLGAYGCALSHRLILRDARRRGGDAVVCLEDDVVLHPEFVPLMEALAIPDDWGIFYFGCNHMECPEIVNPGVVRVRRCFSTHAFAVRRAWMPRVIAAFAGRSGAESGSLPGCDVTLSALAREIPTYAAFPNLAWQSDGFSDLWGRERTSFHKDGGQHRGHHPWLAGLEREMAGLVTSQQA